MLQKELLGVLAVFNVTKRSPQFLLWCAHSLPDLDCVAEIQGSFAKELYSI